MKLGLKENKKLRELIAYLIFGVLTTAVSMLIYFIILWAGEHLLALSPEGGAFYYVRIVAEILQWVGGVLFAFFTNKKWVFTEADQEVSTLKQLRIFAGSRLLTLGLDALLTFGTVWILQTAGYREFSLTFIITLTVTADLISKIVAAVFVVISNYFISKIFVFKNKKN